MFQMGRGTAADPIRAVEFFRESANRGYAPAQRALARMFELGKGTPLNLVNAFVWYSLAKQQGDQIAAQRLPPLASKLSNGEHQHAQEMLAKWSAQMFGGD
jgi:TPR repeat protein